MTENKGRVITMRNDCYKNRWVSQLHSIVLTVHTRVRLNDYFFRSLKRKWNCGYTVRRRGRHLFGIYSWVNLESTIIVHWPNFVLSKRCLSLTKHRLIRWCQRMKLGVHIGLLKSLRLLPWHKLAKINDNTYLLMWYTNVMPRAWNFDFLHIFRMGAAFEELSHLNWYR